MEGRRLDDDRFDRAGIRANALPLLSAEHRVDLRDLGAQFSAVQRREATGDDELLALPLARRELEDGVDRLLFRGVDEAAGVDDDHVGRGWKRDFDVGAVAEDAADALAIRDVFRATERDDVILHDSS